MKHLLATLMGYAFLHVCAFSQTPQAIVGFADLHNHQFANLGFGGAVLVGEPFNPGGTQAALDHCDFAKFGNKDYAGNEIKVVSPAGAPQLTPIAGWNLHKPLGSNDLIGAVTGQGLLHAVGGFPEFDGWPRWNTTTHQQVYMDWLHRALQGGMRLMVMQAVSNEVFCELSNQRPGFGCDDMAAVDKQIAAAKAMEQYIDSISGGAGLGWYRIAYSAAEARKIIESGRLAVVLGIEVDGLLGCKENAGCTEEQVAERLEHYYDLGVRHMFPIHLFDNGFGGAAVYEDWFDAGNLVVNGHFFNVYDCSSQGYEFNLGLPSWFSGLIGTLGASTSRPATPNVPGLCNTEGLRPLGETMVRKMMGRHMIIDIDHMSARAADRTLQIAEQEVPGKYPVVAGHTGFVATSIGQKKSEGQKSDAVLDRIRGVGGLLAPITHQGDLHEIASAPGSHVHNDCGNSTKTWAQAYQYAVQKMQGGAVALGTDFNGLWGQAGPRFGPEACAGDGLSSPQDAGTMIKYPFVAHGTTLALGKSTAGNRVFNFNFDGLAHVGLLPDFVQDLRNVGLTDEDLKPLFNSAEAYVRLWEKAESSNAFPPAVVLMENSSAVSQTYHGSANIQLAGAPNRSGWGVKSITYSLHGAQNLDPQTVVGTSATVRVSVAGVTNVTYYATDEAGNKSVSQTVAVTVL